MPTRTSARKAAVPVDRTSPPPRLAPPVAPSGMTRRSKRVVESESPEAEPEPELETPDDDLEAEDDDAEGEDDEGEDMDIDDEYRAKETTIPPPSETPTPPAAPAATGIKLRLTLNNKNKNTSTSSSSTATNAEAGPSSVRTSSRAKKQSAKADAAAFEDDVSQASGGTNRGKSGRSSKRVKLDVGSDKEAGSDGDEAMGGADTSRMTARQRARQGDGGFGEHLMMLPEDSGKKIVLSDLEKQRRKEENARRRKLQMDQKMENDRNDVINRLLKAQTGKTRRNVAQNEGTPLSGLDGDDAMNGGGASDSARNAQVVPGMLRFVSSIKSGKFEMLVSAPPGKETAIEFESPPRAGHVAAEKKTEARCAVKGCSEKRKYRSVLDFETGGCSMPHLKLVEQSLRRA